MDNIERAVIEAVRNDPADIVSRLRRIDATTYYEITASTIEDAVDEIIRLRCTIARGAGS